MVENAQPEQKSPNYLDYMIDVLRKNDEFLRDNAKECYEEVVDLTQDAIDHMSWLGSGPDAAVNYVSKAMYYFIMHNLMPFSTAIYTEVLTGNVPACYPHLRLLLESLAHCYIADSRHPDSIFFHERMELVESDGSSTANRLKHMGVQLGVENRFVALWGRLSRDWLHAAGYADKFVKNFMDNPTVSAWSIVVPSAYTQDDAGAISELQNHIAEFRFLLSLTLERYREENQL